MIKSFKQSGFTLIELIAVIVLSGLIAVMVSKVISAQLNSIYNASTILNADAQLRVALARITRDLTNIDSITHLSPSSTANSLVFVDNNNLTITYSLSGSSLMRNSDILADGVQSLSFTYYDKSGTVMTPPPTLATTYVTISLAVALRNTTVAASTTVFLRNAR